MLAILAAAISPRTTSAQRKPKLRIDADCEVFAIAPDNRIAYSVPHMKRIKKIAIERDDIWIASPNGKTKLIVDPEKFMPAAEKTSYVVNALSWSPDGKRIVADLTVQKGSDDPDEPVGGTKSIALLDDNGREIKVAGTKARFIENATDGTWLADDRTVVYLTGERAYTIVRTNTSDGKNTTLFAGHTFDAVAWDAKRNQAFAVSENLSVMGKLALLELDLVHEGIRQLTRLEAFEGQLTVSSTGSQVGFFADGDTIEVRDLTSPMKPVRVKTGMGKFEFGREGRHILLKRGPENKSGDLVWVGLYDGTFVPLFHSLEFHDFQIAPDGDSLAVTQVGKAVLSVYALR
ncbi:MAG: hypothetical protein ACRD4S_05810 [Candidatus Acidiferrales bacterium]